MAGLDLKDLARRGAAARLAELQAEAAAILKAFPGLKGNLDRPFTRRGIVANTDDGTTILPGKKRRRRRKMSAAQKAEVSRRMKAYWAKRRQSKA
jgi:hypothetical protein